MKRLMYLFALFSVLVISSCSSEQTESPVMPDSDSLCVFHLNLDAGFSTTAMTRAATTDLTDICENIDVYIIATGNKALIAEAHQVNTDENFGSITLGLPKGTYNIYAYAHNGGTIARYNEFQYAISYPSFFFGDVFEKDVNTLGVTADAEWNWTLKRIVSKFKLALTDNRIPDKVAKMRIKVKGVGNRYIPSYNVLDSDLATDYVSKDFDITTHTEKNFEVILLPKITASSQGVSSGTCDIIIESLLEDGTVLESRSFTGVTLSVNHVTTYTGSLFSPTYGAFTFSIDPTWIEDTPNSFN